MSAIIFDSETTGFKDPVIVEAAWAEVLSPFYLDVMTSFEQRYNPGKPIELGALSTHHILDEDLVDCPPSSTFSLPAGTEYLIGHNVDYDWEAIGRPDVKRICTLALSKHLFEELDSHSQSSMVYVFERQRAKTLLTDAHSAKADINNCRLVLRGLLKELGVTPGMSWNDLWEISEKARIPRLMPFGKHKGEPIADLPADYRAWLLRQADVDPYLVQALRAQAPRPAYRPPQQC